MHVSEVIMVDGFESIGLINEQVSQSVNAAAMCCALLSQI